MAHIIPETDTFSPTVTVPDDGDVANASSVNGAFGEVTDRSRYLYNRQILSYPENDATATPLYAAVGSPPNVLLVESIVAPGTSIEYSTVIDFDIEDLVIGDIIKITGAIQFDKTTIVGNPFRVFFGIQATGAPLDGWSHTLDPAEPATQVQATICSTTVVTAAMAPTFRLQLAVATLGAFPHQLDLMSPYNLLIERFRK